METNPGKVYIETLFHYQCATCERFFTISDREIPTELEYVCPYTDCRKRHRYSIGEIKKTKEKISKIESLLKD